MNFISPETRMIVLPDAGDRTIVSILLDNMPECDGQTDGRTDGQTVRAITAVCTASASNVHAL